MMPAKDRRRTPRFQAKPGDKLAYGATSADIRDLSLEGVLSSTPIRFRLGRNFSLPFGPAIRTSCWRELSGAASTRKAWELNLRKSPPSPCDD